MYLYVEGLHNENQDGNETQKPIEMTWYIEVTDGNFTTIPDSATYKSRFDLVEEISEKFKDMHYYLNDSS